MEWLAHSQKKYCELCKTPFRFTKLYDQSMPAVVPWPLFMRQLFLHSFRALGKWLRYSLAISIWLCWLPWTIRQIWRGLFWIADGSWLTTQEMRAAVEAYASHMTNDSSSTASALSVVSSNTTVAAAGGTTFSMLLPTLTALLGILDPMTLLRAILRVLVSIAIHPTVVTEPVNWSSGAILFAHISRPPSLLSDFQSIASATRFPILNNALIDILEGQLVCLAIVTAFILVFLIREWVINQQPLLNVPDPDPAENALPQRRDEPRRGARRRRRNFRNLPDANLEREDRPVLPAHPRIRRVATENNILVQNHGLDQDRPVAPQRAASLVPALQELEDNVRSLGEYHRPSAEQTSSEDAPLESPPLQRGVFDDVGYIRRTIEEREEASSSRILRNLDQVAVHTAPAPDSPTTLPEGYDHQAAHSNHTPERVLPLREADLQQEIPTNEVAADAEQNWVSDSGTDPVHTPETSSDTNQEQTLQEPANDPLRRESEDHQVLHEDAPSGSFDVHDQADAAVVHGEVENLWVKISKWLWHTDEDPEGVTPAVDADDIDAVVNVDGDNLLGPAVGHHERHPAPAPAVPRPQENPPPNIQNGVNLNNQDAIDDAEDLEGIMELLGMEGPIAGMVQNIIFSVFLITLTLSASIWCPYIWGKITLLFVAHPFSVFVKAPLYLLSRTADVIVDIGLFVCGILGVLVNQFTKLAKILLSLTAPSLSKYVNPDVLDKLSISLSQKSGARLEKTFMRAVLGFRPDLPTFSVQAHHVLRVFMKTGTEVFGGLASSLSSSLSEVSSNLTWQKAFTAPVHIGSLAKQLPELCVAYSKDLKAWHAQLQEDLRPLSFSDPNEIDYTLVQWSSKEKIACIALGYALFGLVGYIYLKVAPFFYGVRRDEKVSGFLADTLRQAGGVTKVVIIIGIEMIVFPLYCGTMLDFALLPIFEGATVQTRMQFFANTPLTALFIHWFIGTCYMFHFALFVSMCRKIMRKGVLYFIRDPDDPTFHPVRDVLERPVATQLGKIAFSAFVYGSLLVICLGGVVAGLDRVGGILPLRWGVADTIVIMPGDIVFFNFILPFVLRKVDLSDKLSIVFEWWFRACAAGLRLSDFMFGVDNEKEKQSSPFLWKQFFKQMFATEEEPSPVKDLKEVAKIPERLLWFEADDADTIEKDVREAAGTSIKYKNVHQFKLEGRVQALIEFEDATAAQLIKKEVNEKSEEPGRTHLRAKSIGEIQIDVKSARDTPIDMSAGSYVRAPAKDSVRIPKGTKVFVRVNEKNERLDNTEDNDDGLHGKKNESFSRIYVPNHFRARVLTFIAMVWGFAALAGLSLSVGPLLLGRRIVLSLTNSETHANDLYAVTVGLHVLCVIAYGTYIVSSRWKQTARKIGQMLRDTHQLLPWVVVTAKKVAGFLYLGIVLGVALPLALSFIVELYINIPLFAHLLATEESSPQSTQPSPLSAPVAGFSSTPVINLIQTWTLGLLYLRLVVRLLKTTPHEGSRPAVAIRSITRRGFLHPDVPLATRALILPITVVCTLLLGLPPLFARVAHTIMSRHATEEKVVNLYRYAYPVVLSTAVQMYVLLRLNQKIDNWRTKIRDEVYLIGERLHNFPAQEDNSKKDVKRKSKQTSIDSGKGKERATSPDSNHDDHRGSIAAVINDLPFDIPSEEDLGSARRRHTDTVNLSIDTNSADTATTRTNQRPSTREVFQNTSPDAGSDTKLSNITTWNTTRSSSMNQQSLSPPQSPIDQDQHDVEYDRNPKFSLPEIDQSRLSTEIDDFREVTGLQEVAGVDDIGDVGRMVFGADERHD